MKNGFKILDSDMHLREPADLWDKYMEPEWRARAPKVLSSTARSSAMVPPLLRRAGREPMRARSNSRTGVASSK